MTSKQIPVFSEYFKFGQKEEQYFEALVDYSRTKTKKEEKYYFSKMQSITSSKKEKVSKKIVEDFSIFSNPLSFYILEAIELLPIQQASSAELLYKIFNKKYPKYKINNVLKTLINLQYIEIQGDQLLKRKHSYLFSKQDELNIELRQYHAHLLHHAYSTLKELPLPKREFNGVSMNIPRSALPHIKQYLRECIDEYVSKFESKSQEGELISQLNIQFFIVGEKSNLEFKS